MPAVAPALDAKSTATLVALGEAVRARRKALGISAVATAEAAGISRGKGWIPARIRLDDYPQLRELAWQVHGTPEVTPREALDIYERNWPHVDAKKLSAEERELVEALRLALGTPHV
jgi:hypothetical protein